ncbi:uncharacterized protein E0L32_009860 [Thyridium curvatum]|uniref:TAFII28-like protein domain-containing protein n=1 Tax=Thyridium curvatum TaxID=1093900 RepID=A0A507AUT4_9PEZI|nr:uncharacterized protein E0L32_009860 [Thyridium curvatum]TPX08671.1 hypothetical protein E0L32_009860 [Thyridium curvatum]
MASPPPNHPPSYSPSFASRELPAINTSLGMGSKKRSAADGSTTPANKRRKASIMSAGSAHPLRQTSFPPDEAGTPFSARSPSVDVETASLVSASASQLSAAGRPKKKRGRKSKAEKAREQTPSVAGGRAPTAVSGTSGPRSNVGAGNEAAEDDEAEGDMQEHMAKNNATRTEEERKEEKRLRAMLASAMDLDQFERFSAWRAAKLPDSVIKRLVNATVSQSVPPSVVTAVRSVTKYFLTDLIVKARRVQGEWSEVENEKQADVEYPGRILTRNPEAKEKFDKQAKEWPWEAEKEEVILQEPPRGPLRPDHLREAWRRYKTSLQGSSTGLQGLWHVQQHSGVERFPSKTGGRRIFK